MNASTSDSLRRAARLLEVAGADLAGEGARLAARAADRLVRDLLPRTSGDSPYLVVGIVGPNNAGKSALFNALAGRTLSPSLATGGATRRLVGAAHPALLARLTSEPTLARFPLVAAAEAGERGDRAALEPAEDAAECRVTPVAELPENLLLIDTPDFDSILADNRRASESLLAVADLALVVVTRHSYQNREVVTYLQDWLAHERPWLLLYNEAPSPEVVREHAAKLAADVGSEPILLAANAFDMAVQDGRGRLEPRVLTGASAGRDLRSVLFDLEQVEQIKARALLASLAQFRAELRALAECLSDEGEAIEELRVAARSRAAEAGRHIASSSMPGEAFLAAFSRVRDRRGNPLSRGVRGGLRSVRLKLGSLASSLRLRRVAAEAPPEGTRLTEIEAAELERRWPPLWEGWARDLGSEGRVVAREHAPEGLRLALDRDLVEERRDAAREAARIGLGSQRDLGAFEEVCEELVERAIEERGFDWDLQLASDLLTVAPLAVAALVIVKTGGLGADLGVAGGGALSSVLTQHYARLLGAPITRDARRRWTEMRGEELADVLCASALEHSWPRVLELGARRTEWSRSFATLAQELEA